MTSVYVCGVAGVYFGLWQDSYYAGAFMTAALLISPLAAEAVVRQFKITSANGRTTKRSQRL